MADRRRCFIISPIGDKDSDIRKHADNLLRRIAIPSLSNLNFEIIRVDQSYANSRISDEIVALIKDAELCIVDSFGYNANVMYELGRRHETNRPMIILRPDGQNIVFDLKDIKHVTYNLDDVDSVIDSQNQIKGFLEEFERQGFMSTSSAVSLDAIHVTLKRVERKMDDISNNFFQNRNIPKINHLLSNRATSIVDGLGATRGFLFAVSNKLLREAEEIFASLEPQLDAPTMQNALGLLAGIGSRLAYERLSDEINHLSPELSNESTKSIIGGYIYVANIISDDKQAIEKLEPVIHSYQESSSLSGKDKAFYNNQLGKLYSGIGNHNKARYFYELARSFDPSEPAFVANIAKAALSEDDLDAARSYADMLVRPYEDGTIKDEDVDVSHLEFAIEVFQRNNDAERAASILVIIRKLNPMLAEYLSSR